MKTLYLECNMGASGDMLMSALLELLPEPQVFINKMEQLKIPGVTLQARPSVKCGITGTHVCVTVNGIEEESQDIHNLHHQHEHHHNNEDKLHHHSKLSDIKQLLERFELPQRVRTDAMAVYQLIADAESHAHGKPVEEIHFHEVGTMDAVADIVGVCLLIDMLSPEKITASPIHVGFGQVQCAHGILPVPSPAAAWILSGIPVYGGTVEGELCTPTGAALLKHFVSDFGALPKMRLTRIGYGMGTKDFQVANCIRAMLGETDDVQENVVVLCCNLDDMTPEAVAFAEERFFEGGALDVYTIAAGMKKNRQGVLLTCICRENLRDEMIRLFFKHTTTLGIRESICRRYELSRTQRLVDTEFGTVRIKHAQGWDVIKEKIEYEDAAKIARKTGKSILSLDLMTHNIKKT